MISNTLFTDPINTMGGRRKKISSQPYLRSDGLHTTNCSDLVDKESVIRGEEIWHLGVIIWVG